MKPGRSPVANPFLADHNSILNADRDLKARKLYVYFERKMMDMGGTDERTVALAGRMICASLSLERWNEYLDGIGCGRLSFVDHNHDSNQFDRREGVWISDPMTAVWNLSMMFICVPHELVEKILVLGGLP